MKKYLKYLKKDLKPALGSLPNPETFKQMYGDEVETGDLSNVPYKTVAEWLGIDVEALPPADRLTRKQQIDMANALLQYWDAEDEMVSIIRSVQPKRRYECAVEYIMFKAKYDGYGGFELEDVELTEEEMEDFRNRSSPADDLLKKFANRDPPNYDDNLPF